ncbi:MAG TPA: 3-keto-5-aminohexanoate cleavage protein [Methanolinea sp.]|jgi:uncharacterized protein (DUF849 family)|nr:3-keto-5-aminohexanoate cleavage protein [Methanolinea sp.]
MDTTEAFFDKLIIQLAPTGMVPNKSDTPHVPITPEEIVEDTVKAYKKGVSFVHIHARDEQGNPTYKKEFFYQIFDGIRKRCPGIIICATTSGRCDRDLSHRTEVLELEPEMASLMLGSVNFPNKSSINTIDDIRFLAKAMERNGVKPELEIFEPGFIGMAKHLQEKGYLSQPLHFNLLLGTPGGFPAGIRDLSYLVDSLPEGSTWSAAGIGKYQLNINSAAILMGGHVRVGLEDSIYYDYRKRILAKNEQLVSRIAAIANELGRDIASPKDAREILHI